MCWGLWHRRNKWVWDRVNQSGFGLKAMVFNMLSDWKRAKEATVKTTIQQQLGDRIWSKPPTGWVKINVDAACNQSSGVAGVGCVIRDSQGHFLRARCHGLQGYMQPRIVEALSLQEAVTWTKSWGYTKCIFETDSKLLVEAVNGKNGSSYFHTIAANCHELIKHFEEVLVVFVHRSANTVAHLLAKATYSISGLREWHNTAPDFIACTLAAEEF